MQSQTLDCLEKIISKLPSTAIALTVTTVLPHVAPTTSNSDFFKIGG